MTSYQKSNVLIDAYLLEELSCQISSQTDLKRRSLMFLGSGPPRTRTRELATKKE